MVTDRDRRDLQDSLERELGAGPATTLMELLPPFGWSEVARQSDLVAVRGEVAELSAALRGEMADLRTELKVEMAGLRGEMAELRGEMGELRGQIIGIEGRMVGIEGQMVGLKGELKTEIAELRAQVAGQLPRLITANIASMIGVAGLVLAAAKLA